MGLLAAVALLMVVGVSLAAWRVVRSLDPPYRGVHERRGRHREREWRP